MSHPVARELVRGGDEDFAGGGARVRVRARVRVWFEVAEIAELLGDALDGGFGGGFRRFGGGGRGEGGAGEEEEGF